MGADDRESHRESHDHANRSGERERRCRMPRDELTGYRRGNRDGAGWKVIGRAREYMFQPPFGYYDKGYPGWEVAAKEEMKEAEKK